ncbi:hypothetical protein H2198_010624 [Neophaeococcomyces mojaviensis]|uniref:Uncharacterized protein n=1 Tax=Neophaeococcomyces mojaviensis TaxID=3383035 RepID=A0ACC2ZRA8_9EURO|nr:hypothetical protein H2198_010624 [Knufia sp. JES_112]
MGDAGLAPDELAQIPPAPAPAPAAQESTREVHVLVTGFGPFNTFATNPSWLIASALTSTLEALPPSQSTCTATNTLSQPTRRPPHTDTSTTRPPAPAIQ